MQVHAKALTLAWMPLPGQSGVSRLPPPPWCSKQSCLEPVISSPALPWSPPGKHRHLSGGYWCKVIYLWTEFKKSASYEQLAVLGSNFSKQYASHKDDLSLRPVLSLYKNVDCSWFFFLLEQAVIISDFLPVEYNSLSSKVLVGIICHIRSYIHSLITLNTI